MIKNIIFDIGNVLVRFQPDEAMREIGIEKNKIAVLAHATYENPVWVELDRGVIPENEIIDEMVKVAPQYEADIRRFFKEGKAFVVKAFDYAADWIKELKSFILTLLLYNTVLFLRQHPLQLFLSGLIVCKHYSLHAKLSATLDILQSVIYEHTFFRIQIIFVKQTLIDTGIRLYHPNHS